MDVITPPSISVVIPTHRRPVPLARCLRGISRSLQPGDAVEIVVVDDGSDCSYDEALEAADIPVTYLRQEQSGPATARNLGLRASTGDIVAFLDDDCVPARGWLAGVRQAFADRPELDGVGGPVLALHPERAVARFVDVTGIGSHASHDLYGWQLITANAAFRREPLEAVGGFDEAYPAAAGEDFDLSRRMWAAGFVLGVHAGAVVYHHHPTTVAALVRAGRRYGSARTKLESLDRRLAAADALSGETTPLQLEREPRSLLRRGTDLVRLCAAMLKKGIRHAAVGERWSLLRLADLLYTRLVRPLDRHAWLARSMSWTVMIVGQSFYIPKRYRHYRSVGCTIATSLHFAALGTIYEAAFWLPQDLRDLIEGQHESDPDQ